MRSQGRIPNDNDLLAAWRDGDRSAGEALLARHWAGISRFFINKLGMQCEDLIQETFTACAEGMYRYRGESSFRTYLFGVARNVLLRHLRNKRRDEKHFDPKTSSMAESVRSYVSVLAEDHQRTRLLLALRRLPLDTQTMLELHYWENMSVQEISEVVAMPVNTVKSRMRRGRMQLAQDLEERTP